MERGVERGSEQVSERGSFLENSWKFNNLGIVQECSLWVLYICGERVVERGRFFREQNFSRANYSGSDFFWIALFSRSGFFCIGLFLDRTFSGAEFFRNGLFTDPTFYGSDFF